jgi:hypothetical protein
VRGVLVLWVWRVTCWGPLEPSERTGWVQQIDCYGGGSPVHLSCLVYLSVLSTLFRLSRPHPVRHHARLGLGPVYQSCLPHVVWRMF